MRGRTCQIPSSSMHTPTHAVMSVVLARSTPRYIGQPASAAQSLTPSQSSHCAVGNHRSACSVCMFKCSRLKVFSYAGVSFASSYCFRRKSRSKTFPSIGLHCAHTSGSVQSSASVASYITGKNVGALMIPSRTLQAYSCFSLHILSRQ